MLSNVGLRGMRVDLTQNRLYTLSPGTRQVLAELNEPVNLYFYFSREAAAKQAPLLMPYATRVREFLEELAARSNGKIWRIVGHVSATPDGFPLFAKSCRPSAPRVPRGIRARGPHRA